MSDRPRLAPLRGLVLAGGASRRMGTDKAALEYHGRTQLEWACDQLARQCDEVFVSMRRGQADDAARRGRRAIFDIHDGIGPIAGIAAAQHALPDSAWLVVACDLPFLTDASLERLVEQRDGRAVVAYRSTHDGLPEPLCAIYEPATRDGILAAIAGGRYCPRKFVLGTGVELLEQGSELALENVNTPDELARARALLQAPTQGDGR